MNATQTNPTTQSIAQEQWRVDPLVVGPGNISVSRSRGGKTWVQVAVCPHRAIAQEIVAAMNARIADYEFRHALIGEDGQARVLGHMLHLLERRGVE